MNQPLVTIGVALYNDEKHVRRTLECILAQSYRNLEILVSDDCSRDGTAAICREYQQKEGRIIFMSQRRNVGALANHELLFNLSSGEYFMWCTGHDSFDANYIRKCVEALESDPELVLCYSKAVRHDYYDKEHTELFDALDTRGLAPKQRFQAVLCAVVKNPCMFYGLFRTEVLQKSKRHRKTIGGDLIFINEIGILGHILQLEDTTFHRYVVRPPSENRDPIKRWLDVIVQPCWHQLEAVTPWLYMAHEYLAMVAGSELAEAQKGALLKEAVRALDHTFGAVFRAETEQLLKIDVAGIGDSISRSLYLAEMIRILSLAKLFHQDKYGIDRMLHRCLELNAPSPSDAARVHASPQPIPPAAQVPQGREVPPESAVRISFVMSVLNGIPFMEPALRAIYEVAHEIVIVEGAVQASAFAANPDGSSIDGTVELARNFPDPQGKIRLLQGLWPGKHQMRNAALDLVTGNYVWLVEPDEVYKRQDLATIKRLLEQTPSITQVNFIPEIFWKGFDTILASPQLLDGSRHYRRLFKYVPGARFTDDAPTLLWPGQELATEQRHLIGGKVTRALGISIYHYSYVLDAQVRQKIELYKRCGWGERWGLDLNQWYQECFLSWSPEEASAIESRYPVWIGDRNSRTVPFSGSHPEEMLEFIHRSRTGTAASEANRPHNVVPPPASPLMGDEVRL